MNWDFEKRTIIEHLEPTIQTLKNTRSSQFRSSTRRVHSDHMSREQVLNMVRDVPRHLWPISGGLHRGDPMSPFLFALEILERIRGIRGEVQRTREEPIPLFRLLGDVTLFLDPTIAAPARQVVINEFNPVGVEVNHLQSGVNMHSCKFSSDCEWWHTKRHDGFLLCDKPLHDDENEPGATLDVRAMPMCSSSFVK